MTNKTLKPCPKIGCPNLTRERYCTEHTYERKEKVKQYNKQRDEKHVKFYNSRIWREARQQALVRDRFLCVHCKQEGRLTKAKIVDHIEELKHGGWDKRTDLDNLQSLCVPCHNTKTKKEQAKRNINNKI